jgi:hypothetical protein
MLEAALRQATDPEAIREINNARTTLRTMKKVMYWHDRDDELIGRCIKLAEEHDESLYFSIKRHLTRGKKLGIFK